MGPKPEPAGAPTNAPIPGAPDPLRPDTDQPAPRDAGAPMSITEIEPVVIGAAPKQKPRPPVDAGVADAAPPPADAATATDAGLPLPPVPDGGVPADANRRAD